MKSKFKKALLTCMTVVTVGSLVACGSEQGGNDDFTHETVTLTFGGSTSVEKIAKALTQAFDEECIYFEASHNHTGSSDAYKYTQGSDKNSATKLDVGFLSRELKSSEVAASGTSGLICKDGIVAVINKANTMVDNLTAEQLKTIYSTPDIKWKDITGNDEDTTSISRYTRDSSSGTRDGFFTAIGYSDARTDDSKLPGASTVTSNGDMIAKIKNDVNGIGYISLASLAESSLKGLKYDGVVASEAAVVDGTYKLSRNFNYITRTEVDCTEAEWDVLEAFMLYLESREALTIIAAHDGILTSSISDAKTWSQLKDANPEVKQLCHK